MISACLLLFIENGQAGYITSHGTYKSFDDKNGKPIDQTSNFTTLDTMVVSWIYLRDMNVGDNITWDLYDPTGYLHHKEIHNIKWSGIGWARGYYLMGFLKPGLWKIVISLNDNIEATEIFYIKGSISHYGEDCIKCHNSPSLQTFWALHASRNIDYRHINIDTKSGIDILDNNDCITCHYDITNIVVWNGSSLVTNVIQCSRCKRHDITMIQETTMTPVVTITNTPVINITIPDKISDYKENIDIERKDSAYKFNIIYIIAIILSISLIHILRKK